MISAFLYLLQGKLKFFNAVLKAYRSYFAHRKNLRRDRKEQLKKECIKTTMHPEVYKKSIVISYFIKQKKRFRDLDFPLHRQHIP